MLLFISSAAIGAPEKSAVDKAKTKDGLYEQVELFADAISAIRQDYVDEIDSKMDRFIVTRRGKPVALMMSVYDYESILETIDILSDKHLMKRIRKAGEDIEKGSVKMLSNIEKELGLA